MSTAARAPAWNGFALLAFLTLACCANTDEQAEWRAFKGGVRDAMLRRDFDAIYPLVRAEMNRQTLDNGREYWIWDTNLFAGPDDRAVLGTGFLLVGGFEMLVKPQQHPEDYDERLREPSLLQNRFRAAVVWFRRAADRGVIQAGGMLSGMYRDRLFGLPMDDELARCFEDAAQSRIVIAICRRLEQAKGYDPGS